MQAKKTTLFSVIFFCLHVGARLIASSPSEYRKSSTDTRVGRIPRGTGPEFYPSNDGKTPSFAATSILVKNPGFFPSQTNVRSPSGINMKCVVEDAANCVQIPKSDEPDIVSRRKFHVELGEPMTCFPRGAGHLSVLFVTGKNPVLTGKHGQMRGFSRHVTGKFEVQSLWALIES